MEFALDGHLFSSCRLGSWVRYTGETQVLYTTALHSVTCSAQVFQITAMGVVWEIAGVKDSRPRCTAGSHNTKGVGALLGALTGQITWSFKNKQQ